MSNMTIKQTSRNIRATDNRTNSSNQQTLDGRRRCSLADQWWITPVHWREMTHSQWNLIGYFPVAIRKELIIINSDQLKPCDPFNFREQILPCKNILWRVAVLLIPRQEWPPAANSAREEEMSLTFCVSEFPEVSWSLADSCFLMQDPNGPSTPL